LMRSLKTLLTSPLSKSSTSTSATIAFMVMTLPPWLTVPIAIRRSRMPTATSKQSVSFWNPFIYSVKGSVKEPRASPPQTW
jgi:hypothetical protein